MKTDDFVTKDIESYIVSLGYIGLLPIEVRLVATWLNEKFPNSILREGYYLWREDLYNKACEKYPYDSKYDNNYHARRNHIVRLAINEIKQNSHGQ